MKLRRGCVRIVPHHGTPRCPCVRDEGHPRKCLCEHGTVRDYRRVPKIGRPAVAGLVVVLVFGACAGVTEVRYALAPKPNECQVTEVRATAFSTFVSGVCWDEAGKVIGMAGAGGKPAIEVPLDLLGAAASIAGPVGAAVILGRGVQEAVKRLPASTTTITVPPPSAP